MWTCHNDLEKIMPFVYLIVGCSSCPHAALRSSLYLGPFAVLFSAVATGFTLASVSIWSVPKKLARVKESSFT